ncbi:MAG: hypothetical protein AAGI08_09845 [Bacteroidota bacterium]
MHRLSFSLAAAVALLFCFETPASAQYSQPFSVVSSGATNASGGNYTNRGTVGQAVVGRPSGGNYTTGQGFWYLLGSSASGASLADLDVLLAGLYAGGGAMTAAAGIPTAQPFNTGPWNYSGTESVGSVPSGVADWVLVRLYNGSQVLQAQRAAFVKTDGSVTDLDGTSAVEFAGLAPGSYFIVIDSRNHLAVRSASTQSFSAGGTTAVNFETSASAAFGTNAVQSLGGGLFGMRAGDVNADGSVDALDALVIEAAKGASTGYVPSDLDGDNDVDNADLLAYWLVSNGFFSYAPGF